MSQPYCLGNLKGLVLALEEITTSPIAELSHNSLKPLVHLKVCTAVGGTLTLSALKKHQIEAIYFEELNTFIIEHLVLRGGAWDHFVPSLQSRDVDNILRTLPLVRNGIVSIRVILGHKDLLAKVKQQDIWK